MKKRTKTKKLNFRTKPIGATAVEYMIMLILIALVVIGIVRVFGDTISNKVARASGGIETMDKSGSGVGGGKGSANGGKGANSGSAANASGNGSGAGGKKGDGSGSSGNYGNKKGSQMAYGSGGGELEEDEKSGPGINPIVLLIAMGLLGLLIYVMVANKKGS